MKEYIEKSLRRPIVLVENIDIYKKLPLKFRGSYELFSIYLDSVEWMIVKPKKELRLNVLRYDRKQIEKIAEKLGVTKMSVSRCLDEIEYLDIRILDKSGKTRKVSIKEEIKVLWEEIKPKLRNPVIVRFRLAEDVKLEKKAGMSALCDYSMLSDNAYPTYAVVKNELKETKIKQLRQISGGEEIGCEVLELGYFIEYNGKMVQDPFSLILSLTTEDLEDERVQICIEEMLEEYVW